MDPAARESDAGRRRRRRRRRRPGGAVRLAVGAALLALAHLAALDAAAAAAAATPRGPVRLLQPVHQAGCKGDLLSVDILGSRWNSPRGVI